MNKKDLLFLLQTQLREYPKLQISDIIKLLYQNEFGGGHMITDSEKSLLRLQEEAETLPFNCNIMDYDTTSIPRKIESIGNGYCRFYLNQWENYPLSLSTLNQLFVESSLSFHGDMERFHETCDLLLSLCKERMIPFDFDEMKKHLDDYRQKGCPAVSHSEIYRREYAPAYRVIREEYCRFLPVFETIDRLRREKPFFTIAIEGGSGSGKSSLAALLEKIYPCNIFHMDDFFLPICEKSPDRLAQPGGNVAYERFAAEVLQPLLTQKGFSYRPFSCHRQTLAEEISVTPKQINIIEGVYSMHPYFHAPYDACFFLEISSEEQKMRILRRNGEAMYQHFLEEWIPLENAYFSAFSIRQKCVLL